MKRITLVISSLVLILALVLSLGLTACSSTEKTAATTAAPTTTTAAPTTTTTATPAPTTSAAPAPKTTTPPPPTGKPAAFTLSGLSIEPTEIDLGGQVTVTFLVKNTGEIKGDYEVKVTVNNEFLRFKTMTLDGGAQETVITTFVSNNAGTNTVNVNDLSGTFTVKAPPPPPPPVDGTTVYVSVSVDGELLFAAQPVIITDMTVNGAIKAAHEQYYSGGVSGYTAGIDPTFRMYLISKCWGVKATPYVILNGAPIGADPNVPQTVDAAPVVANDNIIICTSSDSNKPAQPVSLTATLSGDSVTVTATAWTLNFTTFTYSSAPLANANVIDPTTGASLGTTDAKGSITVTVPESGVIAIEGLAAINVKALPASAP